MYNRGNLRRRVKTMAKILSISNIHGRLDELKNLFQQVEEKHTLKSFDRIVLLGDYIAFGRKNTEVVKYLMDLEKKNKNVVLLKGNWEDMLLKHEKSTDKLDISDAYAFFSKYGQTDMLKELQGNKMVLNEFLMKIEKMPTYYRYGNFFFSHAGVDLEKWDKSRDLKEFLQKSKKNDFIWGSDFSVQLFKDKKALKEKGKPLYKPFPHQVVFGHTSIDKITKKEKYTKFTNPFELNSHYGIDFGAIYQKGYLGACVFEDKKVETFVVPVGTRFVKKEKKKQSEPQSETAKVKLKKEIKETLVADERHLTKVGRKSEEVVCELYFAGKKVHEMEKQLQIPGRLVEKMLLNLYRKGHNVNLDPFYKLENEKMIIHKAMEINSRKVSLLKAHLPEDITLTEIDAVLAKYGI